MKEFAKTGSLFAGVRVVMLAVSMVQGKFIAVMLGPTATGLYSVINNFLQLLTLVATLNLSVSATKYLSEYYSEGKLEHLRYAYWFCIKYVALASLASFLVIAVFSRQITHLLFGSGDYREYVIITGATMLFSVSAIYVASLNGLFERRAIATVQVLAAMLGLISVVLLVPLFALRGYFVSLLLIAFFTFGLGYISVRRTSVLKKSSGNLDPAEKKSVRSHLFRFSGSNLILIVTQPLSFFIIRYSILAAMGADGVGLYGACLSVATLIFGIFQVNPYYYFPKMNTSMPAEDRVKIINEFFRFSLLTLPPVMIGIILLPDLVVLILYSGKFIPIVGYLSLFVVAEFTNQMAGVFSVPVVGMTKLRFHVIWTFFYYLLWAAGSVFLFKRMGLRGVALMSILAYVIWGAGYYIYLKGLIPLRIEDRNRRIALITFTGVALCLLAGAVLPSLIIRIAIYLGVLGASFFLLDRTERSQIGTYAHHLIGRLRFSS
jgi:O-antigen/teichoic acid export membrane protein